MQTKRNTVRYFVLSAILGTKRFFRRDPTRVIDMTIVVLVSLTVLFMGFLFDIFESGSTASMAEVTLEADEVMLASVAFVLGLFVFVVRLHLKQKREMVRRLAAEKEVRVLAYQDPLTGLANRRMFEEELRRALASPPKAGACHAVLLLDLNGFKQINDTYGHDAGDEVLLAVARRLCSVSRQGDLVARLGGDEFIILAEHLLGAEDASSIALRIIQALNDPISNGSLEHSVGTGIGIALIPTNADTDTEVIRMADVALYRAKTERRSAYRFFDEAMDQMVKERDQMERELRTAIASGSIKPVFRPSRDLRNNTITGFEVVPTWQVEGQDVPSVRFMPIAEETGLVHELSRNLLETACRAASSWPSNIQLSFSLFPGQLKDRNLGRVILDIVANAGMDPHRLEISISENLIVRDLDATRHVFAQLHAAGAKTAIDSFGTGYSTMYHMGELKLDKVKIDRRLAEGMNTEDGAKVFRALAGLGRGLGLAVSVSGAAGSFDKSFLVDSGVDEGQFSGAGISADETASLMTTGVSRCEVDAV